MGSAETFQVQQASARSSMGLSSELLLIEKIDWSRT
jgi:hypothetical protein